MAKRVWFSKELPAGLGNKKGSNNPVQDPNKAWSIMKVKQRVEAVKPIAFSTPKPANHTRFVCISDTHSKTSNLVVPEGDVLLHAGDFSNVGLPKDIERFREFVVSLPHQYKVVIAGNHDLTFDTESYPRLAARFGHPQIYNSEEVKSLISSAPGVTYLEDSGCTVNGLKIWGSPWQPEFCDWAFNLPRGQQLQDKWDLIPDDTDVLITHGPPIGHGDLCQHGGRAGCVNLLQTIQERVKPLYHIFGHIHEAYGITTDGQTVFINCSTCNLRYNPIQPPIIFDLPSKGEGLQIK